MMSVKPGALVSLLWFLTAGVQDTHSLDSGSTFTCYMCSYDIRRKEEWNRPECRNDTDRLGRNGYRECDEDNFCTFRIIYDRGEKVITNYDRRCSAASLGNQCTVDTSHIICDFACQEDFCNGQETIEELKQYLPKTNTATMAQTSVMVVGTLLILLSFFNGA